MYTYFQCETFLNETRTTSTERVFRHLIHDELHFDRLTQRSCHNGTPYESEFFASSPFTAVSRFAMSCDIDLEQDDGFGPQ